VVFAVVEQREPHAGRMAFADIEQPSTFAQRLALARRLRDELEVTLPIYVDGMDDASRALFSDLPSPAFVIDRAGRIAKKLPWAEPEPLGKVLDELLARDAGQPVPAQVEMSELLDHRLVHARQLLQQRRFGAALDWLAVPTAKELQKARSQVGVLGKLDGELRVEALAALTRLRALAAQPEELRAGAVKAAQEAILSAFAGEPLRLVAAQVELAELAAGLPSQGQLWQEALAALPEGAPESIRDWLLQRQPKAER
jgi:hypothetical protein